MTPLAMQWNRAARYTQYAAVMHALATGTETGTVVIVDAQTIKVLNWPSFLRQLLADPAYEDTTKQDRFVTKIKTELAKRSIYGMYDLKDNSLTLSAPGLLSFDGPPMGNALEWVDDFGNRVFLDFEKGARVVHRNGVNMIKRPKPLPAAAAAAPPLPAAAPPLPVPHLQPYAPARDKLPGDYQWVQSIDSTMVAAQALILAPGFTHALRVRGIEGGYAVFDHSLTRPVQGNYLRVRESVEQQLEGFIVLRV